MAQVFSPSIPIQFVLERVDGKPVLRVLNDEDAPVLVESLVHTVEDGPDGVIAHFELLPRSEV